MPSTDNACAKYTSTVLATNFVEHKLRGSHDLVGMSVADLSLQGDREDVHAVLSLELLPRRPDCWNSRCKLVHLLLRYTVQVHSIPVLCHGEGDFLRVPFRSASTERSAISPTWHRKVMGSTHIDQALIFALINSVIVRNGILPTIITVAPSSRRGPSSPAVKISI